MLLGRSAAHCGSMTLPAATAHYYAAAEHSPSCVTPTLNTNKSDLQRKPTRRQDQTGVSLVQGARLLYISKQTPYALNSSLTRPGASIEIMSMARGLTPGQVLHGQEPRRVHTA